MWPTAVIPALGETKAGEWLPVQASLGLTVSLTVLSVSLTVFRGTFM